MRSLRQYLGYIALLIYSAHLLIPLGMVIDYETRKDYFAVNFCENKSEPMLNCNGQCFLAKKLKKVQHQDREHHNNMVKESLDNGEYLPFDDDSNNTLSSSLVNAWSNPVDMDFLEDDIAQGIFHPPEAVA